MATRNDPPKRQRSARKDADVGSIEKNIEKTYGLPKNSVVIVNKDRRNTRSDKKVGNLRKDYDKD